MLRPASAPPLIRKPLCSAGMIRKWLIRGLIGLGVVVLAVTVVIGVAAYETWYQNNYKSLIQTLEAPSQNEEFVLLTDISGFDDRAWYVYQLPLGAALTKEMKSGHDKTGVLFWNYSEAGDHYDNSRIEILKDRYLVFSRGGLNHSLYDLQTRQVLVNDESPWHSFIDSEQFNKHGENPPPGMKGRGMDAWVRSNLHLKIERIVNGTP